MPAIDPAITIKPDSYQKNVKPVRFKFTDKQPIVKNTTAGNNSKKMIQYSQKRPVNEFANSIWSLLYLAMLLILLPTTLWFVLSKKIKTQPKTYLSEFPNTSREGNVIDLNDFKKRKSQEAEEEIQRAKEKRRIRKVS